MYFIVNGIEVQSNLSVRPPRNNDHLFTATTILGSHFQIL